MKKTRVTKLALVQFEIQPIWLGIAEREIQSSLIELSDAQKQFINFMTHFVKDKLNDTTLRVSEVSIDIKYQSRGSLYIYISFNTKSLIYYILSFLTLTRSKSAQMLKVLSRDNFPEKVLL